MYRPVVLHCMDVGIVQRYRLVDKPHQYEALVQFGYDEPDLRQWIPVIELSFARP